MAAKKPVFASRAEGVVELLGEAATEQTAPIDPLDEFTQRLEALLSNPQLMKDLATRNHERVIQQFSIDFVAARYDRLYAGLDRD
jgi:glycosyltransferase involved in cell wall biosynthesis